ncbi:MAG TPA: hypothetical protein VHX92_05855 [Rhizomicrobium sp.]|jgi:hypothetical protein|nr:hypothetical protein [Rhizomicrobium sp.]
MGTRRDALGQTCFLVHIIVLVVIVLGWAWPEPHWLIAYLIFLPAMFLHWKLNRDACVLNNLENWLRHRRWRAPETNREEGAWLRTLLADATGINLTRARMDAVIYGAISLFWLVGLARLNHAF